MKLEEVLPALWAGSKIRLKQWPQNQYLVVSGKNVVNQDKHVVWSTLYNGDWEIVQDSKRIADYLIPVSDKTTVFFKATFPVGSQPEGSVMVPESEREVRE